MRKNSEHRFCIAKTGAHIRAKGAFSPAGSVSASACGRGVHRTPAPPYTPVRKEVMLNAGANKTNKF